MAKIRALQQLEVPYCGGHSFGSEASQGNDAWRQPTSFGDGCWSLPLVVGCEGSKPPNTERDSTTHEDAENRSISASAYHPPRHVKQTQ